MKIRIGVIVLVVVLALGGFFLIRSSGLNLLLKLPIIGGKFEDMVDLEVGNDFVYVSIDKARKMLEEEENKGKLLLPINPDEKTKIEWVERDGAVALVVKQYLEDNKNNRILVNSSLGGWEYRPLEGIALFSQENGVNMAVFNPGNVVKANTTKFGNRLVEGFGNDDEGRSLVLNYLGSDNKYGDVSNYLLKKNDRFVVLKSNIK